MSCCCRSLKINFSLVEKMEKRHTIIFEKKKRNLNLHVQGKSKFETKKNNLNRIPAAVFPHCKPACSHSDITLLLSLPLLSS